MSEADPQYDRNLEEYLDGLAGVSSRPVPPGADEEIRLQGEIDRSLKRIFASEAATGAPATAGRNAGDGHPLARIGGRPWRWVGIAAAVGLATVAALYGTLLLTADRSDRLGPIYHGEVAGGFVPREVCTDAAQFAGWTKEHYGQALYPSAQAAGSGVTLVGWSYGVAMTSYSGVLLARVDGTPVVVVVDKSGSEGPLGLAPPGDSSLRSFRRRIGDLVLYEVTPLPEARVLPFISEAQDANAGAGRRG